MGYLRVAILYLLEKSSSEGAIENAVQPGGIGAHAIVIKRQRSPKCGYELKGPR